MESTTIDPILSDEKKLYEFDEEYHQKLLNDKPFEKE